MKDWSGNVILDARALRSLMLKKLAESGLTELDAQRLGMQPLTAEQCLQRAYWVGAAPPAAGFSLPYRDPWSGALVSERARCLTASKYRDYKDGRERKFNKYTQSADSPLHAFFPALTDWTPLLTDPKIPLIVTEGELKAACATKAGFPTVGLGGVWSFMSRKHRFVGLLPELERVVWEGRKVMVAYDSDIAEKPDVRKALRALAARLILRGAEVYQVDLPAEGDAKVGLDDFIVARGAPAFAALLRAATRLESWQMSYATEANGRLMSNASNALVALTLAPELQDAFAFDLMATEVALIAPLFGDQDFRRRTLTDADATRVRMWLQRDGGLSHAGKEDVNAAIEVRSRELAFHPVRDQLRATAWDGVPRVDGFLKKYLSATDNPEYLARVGAMFLISMIARVEQPGCQVDHALVWIGDQGERKSTACRILAGEWFSDQLPNLERADDKRLSMHMRGKWLIEVAEFGSMAKAEIEDVKKFITRQTEKYTPMYGRREATEQRQCVFVVTTNDAQPLKDETGNRRWWPVTVGTVDIVVLKRDRDQVMAEAFARYQAGELWYPEKAEEQALIKPEQDKRFAGGEWDEVLEEYLLKQLDLAATADKRTLGDYRVTTTFLATNALGFDIKNVTNGVNKKISDALRRLSWEEQRSHGKRFFAPPVRLISELHKNVVPLKNKFTKPRY